LECWICRGKRGHIILPTAKSCTEIKKQEEGKKKAIPKKGKPSLIAFRYDSFRQGGYDMGNACVIAEALIVGAQGRGQVLTQGCVEVVNARGEGVCAQGNPGGLRHSKMNNLAEACRFIRSW
jgi:hypothetical protein